jgi:5-enolpyruvylshikimate-3-phosphate synthase
MTLPKWWVAIQLHAGKKDKQMELNHVEPDLVIDANILKIITYSNGTKILTASVKLKPTRQITLDMLSLCLRGEKYEARESEKFEDKAQEQIKVTPITINNPTSYILFFNVPGESAINSEDVKIYALANNSEYYSMPFGIKFEASL